MLTNELHLFKTNVLIQFFMYSTCFEHPMFIIRKTILYMQPYRYVFRAVITVNGHIKCLSKRMSQMETLIF
jgi:hypothetical protein